jgi:hypothetical protein
MNSRQRPHEVRLRGLGERDRHVSAGGGGYRTQKRMNSPREMRETRLRGLWPRVPGAATSHEQQRVDSSVARRRWGIGQGGAALPRNDSVGCADGKAPRSLRGFPLFQPRVHPPGDNAGGNAADTALRPNDARVRADTEAPRSLRGFPLFQPRVHPPGNEVCGNAADAALRPNDARVRADAEAPRSLRGFPLFQPRVHPPGNEARGNTADAALPRNDSVRRARAGSKFNLPQGFWGEVRA